MASLPTPNAVDRIGGKEPQLEWARSSHLSEAHSGLWKGERASEGQGVSGPEQRTVLFPEHQSRSGERANRIPAWPPLGRALSCVAKLLKIRRQDFRNEEAVSSILINSTKESIICGMLGKPDGRFVP